MSYAGMVLGQELNPQPLAYEAFALPLCYASNPHSASPETSARVELYRPRERLMQRGAQPENSLIHASDLTRASLRARAVLAHAHPFGREQAQDSDCDR